MATRFFLLLVACMLPLNAGCTSSETAAQDSKKPPRDEFAADQVVELPKPAAFDAARSMKYLKDLCSLGPRISGTEGMRKQQALLKEHFEKLGAKVSLQRFQARQTSKREPVDMSNMIVTWHPQKEQRILLSAHYDTRPIADREPDRRHWSRPFVSANDGTSGVAWLMEMGHHIKDMTLHVGVDFIIFDGEEYVFDADRDQFFFGSKHFAVEYKREKPKHKYMAGVLLDLMAGKDASLPWEQNSMYWAGAVVEDIWKTAGQLGVKRFENRRGHAVDDDHVALNKVGIPTVDIIDFDYAHWHRLSDTPDQCSEETLADVAKVLSVWLQKIK